MRNQVHVILLYVELLLSHMFVGLGSPAEYYTFGSGYAMVIVADIVACMTAAFVYLPIYYNLGVTSIYEYLEIRFGRTSRICLTGIVVPNCLTAILRIVKYRCSYFSLSINTLQWTGCLCARIGDEPSCRVRH